MTKGINLLLLVFFVTSFSLSAQDHEVSIKKQFEKYRDLSIAKDFDGLMDYIYPKLFTVMPRETMVAMFNQLDGDEMKFDFDDLSLDQISEVFTYEEEHFATVDYTGSMTIWFISEELQDSTTLDFMEATFATTYGQVERVENEGMPGFAVVFQKQMFAITPKESEDWKFIENNPDQPMIMEMIFPEEVIAHFTKEN